MPYQSFVELAQPAARIGYFASTKRLAKKSSKIGRKDQRNTARLDYGKSTGATGSLVREQTVLRFSARLETDDYPGTRSPLSKLLVAKENKFAVTAERLATLDRHITKCKSFISQLYTLVDEQKAGGRDAQQAERLLRNTLEIHNLGLSYRHVLLQGLDRLTTYMRQSHASRKLARRRPRSLVKPPVGHAAPGPCPSSRRSV